MFIIPCPYTLMYQSIPVRSSILLGPLFHWPYTNCYSLTNTSALSFFHFYFLSSWESMSHHYNILTNTLNIFAPLSFCCIWLANPKHEWNLLLAFTTHWYHQSSWALLEKTNKAGGLSHFMLLTTDFNEASMLLDNPPISPVGMASSPTIYLFQTCSTSFKPWTSVPSISAATHSWRLCLLIWRSYSCPAQLKIHA